MKISLSESVKEELFHMSLAEIGSTIAVLLSPIVALISYILKKPQLLIERVFIQSSLVSHPGMGGMPDRETEEKSLVVEIKNVGKRAAENVKLETIKFFNGKEREKLSREVLDLDPNCKEEKYFSLNKEDINERNQIQISLSYSSAPSWWKLEREKKDNNIKSSWQFNYVNGHLFSDNLYRVKSIQ